LAHLLYHASYTLDDAYISFRYARNWVRGVGLVYNPGDYVKGYSNTLYTLLMGVPELLGRDPISLSKLLGFGSFAWLGFLGYRFYATDPCASARDRTLWWIAWLAMSAGVAVHFMGGLETGLHTVLIFAAVTRRLQEQRDGGRPWSAWLFCGVVWGRPEGIALFGAMAFQDLCWRARTRQFARGDVLFLCVPLAAFGLELAVSAAYYGAALPQTYYAKLDTTHDAAATLHRLVANASVQAKPGSYLAEGLRATGVGVFALIAVPLACISGPRRREHVAFALVVLAQLVFVVSAGSDWAPGFRFGVPMLPLLFVLMAEAISFVARVAGAEQRKLGWLLATAITALALPQQRHDSRTIHAERPVNAAGKLAQGAWLATLAPPGVTLSSFDIGGQGYAGGGFEIFDTVGLTVRATVGCRDRKTPRCRRLATLELPELVRLHSNHKRDAFVSETVRAAQPYLELAGGKYLLSRALVLMPRPDDWAVARAPQSVANAELIAHDLPEALPVNSATQGALYWRRGRTSPELESRRLEWVGSEGHFSANANDVLWKPTSVAAWRSDEVFSDLITLRAPPRAGTFELDLVAGGQRVHLTVVEIFSGTMPAKRVAELVSRSQQTLAHGQTDSALHAFARLAPFSIVGARAYRQESVVAARQLREAAETRSAEDPISALRDIQLAKRWLYACFWLTGGADPDLHREIDANAALRNRLIAHELNE
jgi:hypothetical protein